MASSYPVQVSFLAVAAALLLASTQLHRPEDWSIAALYVYWFVRILIEAGLFVAFAELLGRLPGLRTRIWLSAILAAFISLVPFVLSITALDLILGLPELEGTVRLSELPNGNAAVHGSEGSRITSFLLELVYLSDNHLALCLLLSVPKLFAFNGVIDGEEAHSERSAVSPGNEGDSLFEKVEEDSAELTTLRPTESTGNGYQRHLERPLDGDLIHIEAQEHYVRLVSKNDSRMVLYRFNDIVSEVSDDLGIQVHRSHWVAFSAIEKPLRENGRLWLLLSNGSRIPVSRKHVSDVQEHLAKTRQTIKKAAR